MMFWLQEHVCKVEAEEICPTIFLNMSDSAYQSRDEKKRYDTNIYVLILQNSFVLCADILLADREYNRNAQRKFRTYLISYTKCYLFQLLLYIPYLTLYDRRASKNPPQES